MEKQKLRKIILMGVLVVVILVIGYLVYSNFFATPAAPADTALEPGLELEAEPTTPGAEATTETGPQITTVPTSLELNTDLLNDPGFSNLVIFGDLPVEVGEVGRENPFKPFEGYYAETKEEEESKSEEE